MAATKVQAEQGISNYYYERTNNILPSIKTIQNNVIADNQTCIIQYLTTPQAVLAFYITKNKWGVQALKPYTTWKKALETHKSKVDTSRTPANEGYELYQALVEPVLKALNDAKIYRLVIIPDEHIRHIRFDALLLKPYIENETGFLVQQYCVSDAQSIAIYGFQKAQSLKKTGQQFRAFVAHRETDTLNLKQLTRALKGKADTIVYNVNKPTFLQQAPTADIIALVAHNILGEKNERRLVLAGQSYLSMDDVYATPNFKARLGIFTNCGSGLGEEFNADGFQSMARAFAYKIPALLVTRVDDFRDKSYGEIVNLFLENLKIEKSPDIALWKAKNAYLKKHNTAEILPFAWANLVLVGSNSPLNP